MAETIKASEIGPDLAYWLGSNPRNLIASLACLRSCKHARSEDRGQTECRASSKKVTSAPDPIRPVSARNINPGVTDTTDPRSIQSMSTSEWIEADRLRTIAKMKALQIVELVHH